MPKINTQIKKHLIYLLGLLIAFILGIVGLDAINREVDSEINNYKSMLVQQQTASQNGNCRK